MNPQDSSSIERRDFLRTATILGVGGVSTVLGGCSDGSELPTNPAHDLIPGRKWIRVDSTDLETGIFMSLDGFSDTVESVFSADVEWNGHSVLPSGEIIPLHVSAEKDCANSVSLHELGNGFYELRIDGIPYPPGAPEEIRMIERTIPGTEVIIYSGYSVDLSTGNRVVFTVTHDPLPIIIRIALMLASMGLRAQRLGDGTLCAGKGGPKSRQIKIKKKSSIAPSASNFALNTTAGELDITCTTNCNHDQGSGG
jgi:hypothetical protein